MNDPNLPPLLNLWLVIGAGRKYKARTLLDLLLPPDRPRVSVPSMVGGSSSPETPPLRPRDAAALRVGAPVRALAAAPV